MSYTAAITRLLGEAGKSETTSPPPGDLLAGPLSAWSLIIQDSSLDFILGSENVPRVKGRSCKASLIVFK